MKKEIKRTPITFNGEDGFEVLYEDSEIFPEDGCEYCMYEDWFGWEECAASCCTVHGCGILKQTYFQFVNSH